MPEVIVYSTPSCKYCNDVKDFLSENNIQYTQYDVTTDPEKKQEMIDLTGQMGVPVTRIGDDVLVGYDANKLKELLSLT